jgi:transposase
MATPHSDACFVRAYPAATAEAWVDGHVHAFAFFGKVPASVLYESDEDQGTIRGIVSPTNRCLVAKILPDGTRQRATLFEPGSCRITCSVIVTGGPARETSEPLMRH